ncbi:MAG: endonuclease III domain-containing protein [Desulfovibrionaceae bacterium]
MSTASRLVALYEAMSAALGPSRWWPGETPFEVAVGAILTQNTNWGNVERAIKALKEADALSPEALRELPEGEIEPLIRPAGYFRMKAKRLKNLVAFLEREADLRIENLRGRDLVELRPLVLGINGVGPETADSILLYALDMPTFVVDAYTARLCQRHGLIHEGCEYHELQALFTDHLPEDVRLYNEYHALIVRIGKDWCRKTKPRCEDCPLGFDLP